MFSSVANTHSGHHSGQQATIRQEEWRQKHRGGSGGGGGRPNPNLAARACAKHFRVRYPTGGKHPLDDIVLAPPPDKSKKEGREPRRHWLTRAPFGQTRNARGAAGAASALLLTTLSNMRAPTHLAQRPFDTGEENFFLTNCFVPPFKNKLVANQIFSPCFSLSRKKCVRKGEILFRVFCVFSLCAKS